MLRTILAIIAGVVVGGVAVAIVESVGHMIFPPPEGVDLKDPEALKSIMKEIPLGAKVAVLFAWGLGVFTGGMTANLIAKTAPAPAWIVAGVFAAFTAANLFMIPHPVWMIAGAAVAILIGAWAANAMAKFR